MMKTVLTENELLKRGYKSYLPSKFDRFVDKHYQKLFSDEFGRKYYIDIKHYGITIDAENFSKDSYEISTQLYIKGTHDPFNITFLNDDLDEAENFIETLFNEGKLDYYEKFN